jgi:hypothetical protein
MCSPKNVIGICASLLLSTSIGLLITTSLFSFLFSPLASSATSRSRWWTPFSTLVDNPSEDPWADVDYFYFFLSSSCKMGGKITKPKTITVTQTSGFKEEDHSWSIINVHLSCAINTVLSLCAVIFVICILVYFIQRIVRRYCKKKRAAKERQRRISMLPFHQNQRFGTKFDQQDYTFADRYQFPVPVHSSRFTDYQEPPPSRATLQQLLQGLAPAAPPPAAVSPPAPPSVLPPVVPGQLGHPIPA